MRKPSYKKTFAIAALVTLVLVFLPITDAAISPQQTTSSHWRIAAIFSFSPRINLAAAQSQSTNDPIGCASSLGTCMVFFASYLINKLIAVFITLGAFLIGSFLQLSSNISSSPSILTGFSICLAFANLGFVFLIIIIAIATILRSQTYGIKQLLWKLVAMAILINFGLVITMPIINFSDHLSNYFIQEMSPGGDSYGLATQMTNAFAPQTFTSSALTNGQPLSTGGTTNVAGGVGAVGGAAAGALLGAGGCVATGVGAVASPICAIIGGIIGGVGAVAGYTAGSIIHAVNNPNFSDQFVSMVIGMLTSAVILAITALTLITIAILLLVRYVYLTVLLIILPLAWIAWVLPGLSSHFQKWLHLFLRWTFFPPIALFFLYLSLLIVTKQGNQTVSSAQNLSAGAAGIANGHAPSIADQTVQDIALAGLMLGGLFAANSLGIAGAGAAIGYGKSASGWIAGKAGSAAGKQGRKAAAAVVPQKTMEKLQSGGYKFVPKRLQVAAGVGLANVQKAGTSRLVDQEAAWAKEQGKDVDASARMLGSGGLSEAKKFALLKALNDTKKFDPTKLKNGVDGQNIGAFLADKNRFDRYGQGTLRDDLNKSANGASSATMAASAALAAGGGMTSGATVKDEAGILGEVGKTVDAFELLQKSLEKTARSMDKGDLKKQNLNYMYSNETINGPQNKATRDLRVEQLRALIRTKPQLISAHLTGMSQQQMDNFEKVLDEALTKELKDAVASKDDSQVSRLAEIGKSFTKAYARITSGDVTLPDEVDQEKPEVPNAPGEGGKKS